MNALDIKGLHKTFKSNFLLKQYHILKGIDLSVEKGEIYGFLGPNGAGKTTTIKCILGIIFPDAGQITLFDQAAARFESRRHLGFLPEHPYFYDYLTPTELLLFTGRLFGMPKQKIRERTAELLELVGLTAKKDVKLRKFSKGMVQRVGLAQTLIHDPDFLILDEPFSGLDPIGRKELREIILSLRQTGKTVFFSSHILQDMELMVDRVGIILDGQIKKEGKLSQLIQHSVQYYEIVFSNFMENAIPQCPFTFEIRDHQFFSKHDTVETVNQSIIWITGNGGKIISVTPIKRTLEDIFLEQIRG